MTTPGRGPHIFPSAGADTMCDVSPSGQEPHRAMHKTPTHRLPEQARASSSGGSGAVCQVLLTGGRPKNWQNRKLCPSFRVAAGITFQLPRGRDAGPHSLCARPCLLVAVARLAGSFWRLCSWCWCFLLACRFWASFRFPSRGPRPEGRFLPQVSPSMFWDFGFLHRESAGPWL